MIQSEGRGTQLLLFNRLTVCRGACQRLAEKNVCKLNLSERSDLEAHHAGVVVVATIGAATIQSKVVVGADRYRTA